MAIRWTDDEIELLRQGMKTKTWTELSKLLGRSIYAIQVKAHYLHLPYSFNRERVGIKRSTLEAKTLLRQGKKRCSRCKRVRRLVWFKRQNNVYGYAWYCIPCGRNYVAAKKAKDPVGFLKAARLSAARFKRKAGRNSAFPKTKSFPP
jgi:hypothetical protein